MKFTCETGFICFDHVIELHKKPHTNKDIINLEFKHIFYLQLNTTIVQKNFVVCLPRFPTPLFCLAFPIIVESSKSLLH